MNKKNYFLLWEINDYPEMGGGHFFEYFETAEQMDKYVNKNLLDNSRHEIVLACEIKESFNYIAKEKVTILERE